jgi:hypothetical protein
MEAESRTVRLLRSEWIDRKSSHSYKRRFMVLTEQELFVFHEIDPELLDTSAVSRQDLLNQLPEYLFPTSDIQDIVLYRDEKDLTIGYFEILLSSLVPPANAPSSVKTLSCNKVRFRCPLDSASLWVRDMKRIPSTKPAARFYQEALTKPKTASRMTKFLRTLNFSSVETPSYVPSVMFTFEQAEALQRFFLPSPHPRLTVSVSLCHALYPS